MSLASIRRLLFSASPLLCHYCQTSKEIVGLGFTLDHIEPEVHHAA